MKKSDSERFLDELKQLNFSKDGIPDLINLVDQAIKLSSSENPDRTANVCLKHLMQTRDKELQYLKVAKAKDKQSRFKDAITAFRMDLTVWCMD